MAIADAAVRIEGSFTMPDRHHHAYLVPTNADIPELDVLFEFDEEASPLGAKGNLGELTAVSVARAIANAVYNATGKRVRDLPITVEKLL